MRIVARLSASVALATVIAPARAQTPPPATPNAAAAFGARESLQRASLSPDGSKVALIVAGPGRGGLLLIGDLVAGGEPKSILRTTGDPDELRDCDWSSATRLICSATITENVDGRRLTFGRLIALNADGSDLKMVSVRDSSSALGLMQNGGQLIDWGSDGTNGAALVTRQFVPEESTGTHLAENRTGLAVEMIDTNSLKRRVVEPPRADAVEYISDGYGTVRVMGIRPRTASGYDGSRINYLYRTADSRDWVRLSQVDILAGSGFDPVAVDRDLNVVYGYDGSTGGARCTRSRSTAACRRRWSMRGPTSTWRA